ncbi:ABC transporter ATP-binding protein [Jiangella mangrovi]|uniref:Iron(III) transport system ATP-binding protein n=1 Tax=Jiangella mangrovi TaxID=1524084 RepID=A0A7W9GUA0_9ACTN|nr:ABC transporter ATP-binding protein [Jiangella mangrovi]MBB5790203.1 iron(III) transport system ATP-binding protein [Jiangella mangrovi]
MNDLTSAAPGAITLTGLSRRFVVDSGEVVDAVAGVDLDIRPGEFFTLLGPSGSGKTTILRCVAGLERPDGGEVRIGGRLLAGPGTFVPPQDRAIGMVFQSYAIWPHLSVFDNVAFPLRELPRKRRPSATEIERRVAEALDVVGLSVQSQRSATRLSGGQQQRVAIARAIVGRPEVLLLDEPLSNLDAVLRAGMRLELRRLTKELGITALYVTHDQTEALEMSDRIAVVDHGRVLQCGPPVEIYRAPANVFVAEFVGTANRLDGEVVEPAAAGAVAVVRTAIGPVRVVARQELGAGERIHVVVRPESLHPVSGDGGDGANHVEGAVTAVSFAGAHTHVRVDCAGVELRAEVHRHDDLSVGDRVWFRFGPEMCAAVPDTGAAAVGTRTASELSSTPTGG